MEPNRLPERIRVLLVDDNRIMRDGLRFSLERQSDIEVVGDVGDGPSAVRLSNELSPDAVVVDFSLPDRDSLDLWREIRARRPCARVVMLIGSVDREHLDRALAAGIRHCVSEAEAASELHTAIRRAMRGQAHLSQEITEVIVQNYQVLLANKGHGGDSLLSDRETIILTMIADGRNTKEIAHQLGLSVKSIDYYRKRLMTKLEVSSVAMLTRYAIRKRLTKA